MNAAMLRLVAAVDVLRYAIALAIMPACLRQHFPKTIEAETERLRRLAAGR